jgi:hypothetical protein
VPLLSHQNDYYNYLANIDEGFYDSEEIATLHKITKGFNQRFSQIPTKDQVKLIARQDQFKDRITESIIDLIFDEPIDSYDPDWLRERSEAWILWKSLQANRLGWAVLGPAPEIIRGRI